ncbi:MAG: AzlC family ABC transporter permease [Rhodospirillales bacterium]|nr:AzlC family ABC transporter permease [Rhodospirillales bacterium]
MNASTNPDPQTRREAALLALRDAAGAPAIGIFASYFGFGALIRESGLTLQHGLFSTFSAWALPGQIVVVEMLGIGASLMAIGLAVLLTNIRLLPMVVTLLPVLHDDAQPRFRWSDFSLAAIVVITPWVFAMMRCPRMIQPVRTAYYVAFALMMWTASFSGTILGFVLTAELPRAVAIGLVFLNPLYFMFILALDLRTKARILALAFGAILGPTMHLVSPDWGLMISGLLAGTLAVAGEKLLEKRG